MPKKKALNGKPEVHSDLKGFNITINEFGEIITNLEVDKPVSYTHLTLPTILLV